MSLARTAAPQARASATGRPKPSASLGWSTSGGPAVDRRQRGAGRAERRASTTASATPRSRPAAPARASAPPPTLTSRAPGSARRTPANVASSTSIRLRGMFEPTCSRSGGLAGRPGRAAGRPRRRPPGRARGVHSGWCRGGRRAAGLGEQAVRAGRPGGSPRCRRRRPPPCEARRACGRAMRPEPARAGLAGRLQQAAERVEVVAGDDRPAGRQDVDELGVAVVHQVEQVELAAPRPCRGACGGSPRNGSAAGRRSARPACRRRPAAGRSRRRKGGRTRVGATRSACPGPGGPGSSRRPGPCSASPPPGSRRPGPGGSGGRASSRVTAPGGRRTGSGRRWGSTPAPSDSGRPGPRRAGQRAARHLRQDRQVPRPILPVQFPRMVERLALEVELPPSGTPAPPRGRRRAWSGRSLATTRDPSGTAATTASRTARRRPGEPGAGGTSARCPPAARRSARATRAAQARPPAGARRGPATRSSSTPA